MEKLIKIKDINISTTPNVIAQDVFNNTVSPIIEALDSKDRKSTKEFTFYVMWLAMGLYINNLSTKDAEKALNLTISKVIEELKKMRGEV